MHYLELILLYPLIANSLDTRCVRKTAVNTALSRIDSIVTSIVSSHVTSLDTRCVRKTVVKS